MNTKFSRKGGNEFPKISWKNVPNGTKYLALYVVDPDAPNKKWVHLLIKNIPNSIKEINNDNIDTSSIGEKLKNSWNNKKWEGPQPPKGKHHYEFHLYALKEKISANEIFSFLKEINIKKIAEAIKVGTYQK